MVNLLLCLPMRCIPSQLRKQVCATDGNATLGFVLVAPLVVAVFIVVLQLVAITREQAALTAIAHDASRIASVSGGQLSHGMNVAHKKLGSSSVVRERANVKVQRLTYGGVNYVQTTVSESYPLTWFAKSVTLTTSVRSVDESAL